MNLSAGARFQTVWRSVRSVVHWTAVLGNASSFLPLLLLGIAVGNADTSPTGTESRRPDDNGDGRGASSQPLAPVVPVQAVAWCSHRRGSIAKLHRAHVALLQFHRGDHPARDRRRDPARGPAFLGYSQPCPVRVVGRFDRSGCPQVQGPRFAAIEMNPIPPTFGQPATAEEASQGVQRGGNEHPLQEPAQRPKPGARPPPPPARFTWPSRRNRTAIPDRANTAGRSPPPDASKSGPTVFAASSSARA